MTKHAFLFPGQGSQSPGMGKALAENFAIAKQVFAEVDDTLNQHLSKVMFEGPESDLNLTANTQPAIMACSIAAWRVLQSEAGVTVTDNTFVAGHSLGEYAALVAAESLTLAQAAGLLRIRGDAMQQAVPAGLGAMAAIIGLSIEQVEKICQEIHTSNQVCEVANDNNSQQIVISGHAIAIEQAMEAMKAAGAKRAVPLTVSAPFHCSLMKPAAERMAEALHDTSLHDAACPVITNVTAGPVELADALRDGLIQQVTGRVRWRESVEWMAANGVTTATEIGHGNVLAGLIKRIAPEMTVTNVNKPEDIKLFEKAA
ncbi:MAG: [acyl-carrier-protein] S-malonyltransferase [Rickettsiales bacterium]|nr:[acyl-carrier-protein] S-malonyltransferase [Rickettsiales bacterium]|tara:strand:+ start:4686 stop:5630 length:945 start_codon:yes stop_codon:yes gene_type:complete